MSNNINIEEDFISKSNIVNIEKQYNNIQNYMNNFSYKTSYINIDSRFRNTTPQNVVEMLGSYLPNNSITTFANEHRVQVNIGTNNFFNIGDKIILQNITGRSIILNGMINLISNYNYYMVEMKNHNIKPEYTTDYKFNVSIYEPEKINIYDRLIGNIPLNSIIGNHNIKVYSNNTTLLELAQNNSFLPDTIKLRILAYYNISTEELINNYFFIKLPFNYININKISTSTIFQEFQVVDKIFTFDADNIGCIKTFYLNANYPINTFQYTAFQEITNIINNNIIEFNSASIALFSETNGGMNCMIGKVINTIDGYIDANNYTITLKKTFSDVSSIELVSTEIPYVENNIIITNGISGSNSKLYWKYLQDGEYVYSVSIKEGNYYIDTLVEELKKSMNNIKRISSTIKEIIYNEFVINYNLNSQEIKFISYRTSLLPYSLSMEQALSIGSEIIQLTVKHPNNYVNVGDNIIISNSLDIGDINATLINTSHTVYSVNIEAETYTVLISTTQFIENINLVGDGGAKITIKNPDLVSFLFNKSDTMGTLLGFKYVGDSTSITPYSHINSNMNTYIYPTPYNMIGGTTINSNYFNFLGQNYYMLMYINDFENVYSNYNNAFSKIIMKGNPGDTIYNGHLRSVYELDIPLKSLNELKIKFLYPDGTLPDFRNLNHSFTLKIVERLSKPVRTGLNSMKTTYIDSIKEYALNNALNA